MSFKIKIRGAGGLVVAEYRCEACGDFEETLQRDANGDPPDVCPCPGCGEPAAWTISAPQMQVWSVPCVATVRGGDMTDRPPGMLDTRPLAEGMKMSEWRKQQAQHRIRRRHKQLIDKGVIQRKVQV